MPLIMTEDAREFLYSSGPESAKTAQYGRRLCGFGHHDRGDRRVCQRPRPSVGRILRVGQYLAQYL